MSGASALHEASVGDAFSGAQLHVHRLGDAERAAVRAHLLRLPAEDRRSRFRHAATDDAICAHVGGISFAAAPSFGVVDAHGVLRCLAQGFPYSAHGARCLEAAFSTDAGWRRRGFGRLVFHALEAWCVAAGVERIVMACSARNVAMRALLRAIDATSCSDGHELDAHVALPRAASRAAVIAPMPARDLGPTPMLRVGTP